MPWFGRVSAMTTNPTTGTPLSFRNATPASSRIATTAHSRGALTVMQAQRLDALLRRDKKFEILAARRVRRVSSSARAAVGVTADFSRRPGSQSATGAI